jgi:thiosulfate/3-mercaptopyruvate sulfurtransferase
MNRTHRSLCWLVLCAPAFTFAAEDAYPRKELLIEPVDLTWSADAKKPVILDARPRADYEKGHIPGAAWVDHGEWSKSFNDGKAEEEWSKRIGALGLDAGSTVVIYDDNQAKDAARIWWLLQYWGVENARLLNGGWSGWKSEGRPVETDAFVPKPTKFEASPRKSRLSTKDQILKSLGTGKLQIVDSRSEDEHCGVEKLRNRKAGAIPGAKHLEWSDLLDPKTQRFKPAAELRQIFKDAGVDVSKPTATHCQSGGRASVMAFGLELMGADAVSNYYRGWSEWGNADDTTVEPGKPKAKE